MPSVQHQLEAARAAQQQASQLTEQQRQTALKQLAAALRRESDAVVQANEKDLAQGRNLGLAAALMDRLTLTPQRVADMADAVESIAAEPQVVGQMINQQQRSDGLSIAQQRVPLGVIGMVFESRPNVVVDCAALALKSGNAIILKGGKEAAHSNHLLGQLIRQAISPAIPADTVVVLDSNNRQNVLDLITAKGLVDVVIPRGGEGLIQMVTNEAKVPVIAHYKGLCHTYIDASAQLQQAHAIVLNAKTQRPGVCNAMETLLLHQQLPEAFVTELLSSLHQEGVELRLDEPLRLRFPQYQAATASDWDTEYLELILAVKQVKDVAAATAHIRRHGSQHTETVLAEDPKVIADFANGVDCSCVTINASSRFNDGGQLGLGAELGISTTKLHAYGPMGAKEMTTLRYVVTGNGHIRE